MLGATTVASGSDLSLPLTEERHRDIGVALDELRSLYELEVVRLLGVGSYSIVILCRTLVPRVAAVTGLVALRLLMNYGRDSQAVSRDFQNEFRLSSRLRHPHLLHVYRVMGPLRPTTSMIALVHPDTRELLLNPLTQESLKTMAVLMEAYPMTLAARMRGPRLSPTEAFNFCWQLLQAQMYLSSQRLVHLDVKFENILVANSGHLVLSDFSTSQAVDERGNIEAPVLFGNQRHMAPEVLKVRAGPWSRLLRADRVLVQGSVH